MVGDLMTAEHSGKLSGLSESWAWALTPSTFQSVCPLALLYSGSSSICESVLLGRSREPKTMASVFVLPKLMALTLNMFLRVFPSFTGLPLMIQWNPYAHLILLYFTNLVGSELGFPSECSLQFNQHSLSFQESCSLFKEPLTF